MWSEKGGSTYLPPFYMVFVRSTEDFLLQKIITLLKLLVIFTSFT